MRLINEFPKKNEYGYISHDLKNLVNVKNKGVKMIIATIILSVVGICKTE